MKKKIILGGLLLTAMGLDACATTTTKNSASSGSPSTVASTNSDSSSTSAASSSSKGTSSSTKDDIGTTDDPFSTEGNYEAPELTLDGYMTEPEWSDPNYSSPTLSMTRHGNDAASVKFYRGKKALFAFFSLTDDNILSDGNSNGDAVNRSDSVELYIDADNDGVNKQYDDVQINIGANSRTRILTGSDNVWGSWAGLVSYEVAFNGTLNDASDADVGFNVELMVSYSDINITRNSVIGFSIGAPDKWDASGSVSGTDFDWFGANYEGSFIDPQMASDYLVYTNNAFFTRSEYNAR